MEKSEEITVELNPNAVIVPLQKILTESSKYVIFGLQLIDSIDEPIHFDKIKSADVFNTVHFGNPDIDEDILLRKENFLHWVLKKAFEDLIKGINLTLIEAYLFISVINYAKQKNKISYHQLIEEVNILKKSAGKQHMPELLKKIKPHLLEPLLYEETILLLNQARNCLVHRNGIVTEKDISNKEINQLIIEYLKMRVYYQKGKQQVEIKRYEIIPAGTSVKFDWIKDTCSFKNGEEIKLDFLQFNSILTTCQFFGSDLITKLPNVLE